MSIWTDLLVLHGYIVNPATLTEGKPGAHAASPTGIRAGGRSSDEPSAQRVPASCAATQMVR